MEGKRISKPETMYEWYYEIIEYMWCENPNERLKIEEVIKILENNNIKLPIQGIKDSVHD